MKRIRIVLANRVGAVVAVATATTVVAGLAVGAHAMTHRPGRHGSTATTTAVAVATRTQASAPAPVAETTAAHPVPVKTSIASTPVDTASSASPVDDGLAQVPDLPGYGQRVAAGQLDMLHASMVHIEQGFSDTTPILWVDECTGTKVTVERRIFVLTAAHCLEIPDDPYYGGGRARDQTKHLLMGINLSSVIPSTGPTIKAIRVVESQRTDLALLQIDEKDPHSAQFDALPSIAYDALLVSASDLPGQDTFSSSLEVAASRRVDGAGIYLGQTSDPEMSNDIVGLRRHGATDTSERDPCFYGGSGSLAVLADGNLSGPLSWRERTAYYHGETTPLWNDPEPQDGRTYVDSIAAELGVASPAFTTVCGYAVVTTNELTEVAHLFPPVLKPTTTRPTTTTPTTPAPTVPSSPTTTPSQLPTTSQTATGSQTATAAPN